jgi:hypothetical protein
MIRKRMFRFEYYNPELPAEMILSPGTAPSTSQPLSELLGDLPSPIGSPVVATPASATRRRTSHRLSLVPAGQTFQPMSPAKNRRQSMLAQVGDSAGIAQSDVMGEVEESAEDAEEAETSMVDVVDGDDGDKVYIEVQEQHHVPREMVRHVILMLNFLVKLAAAVRAWVPHPTTTQSARIP